MVATVAPNLRDEWAVAQIEAWSVTKDGKITGIGRRPAPIASQTFELVLSLNSLALAPTDRILAIVNLAPKKVLKDHQRAEARDAMHEAGGLTVKDLKRPE